MVCILSPPFLSRWLLKREGTVVWTFTKVRCLYLPVVLYLYVRVCPFLSLGFNDGRCLTSHTYYYPSPPLCLCLSFSFAHARALPLTSPSLRPLLLFCSLHPLRFELSSLDHVSLVALFLSGVFSLPIQTETLLLSQLARNPPFDPSLSRSWRSDHRTAKRKNLAYSMARRSVLLLFVIAVVVGCRRRRRCRRSFRVLLWPIPRPSSLTRSCSSSSPCYHPCVLMEIGGFVLSHVYHPGHLHR